MYSIGDFARIGRVSVRMLRHYDALGLLTPARVDPATGYRSYEAAQLSRLNRLVALKDLGFTLQQVREILGDKVGVAELHGMLRLRRAELEAQVLADGMRLRGVEARIRIIEKEGVMPAEVIVKPVPAVRVAELSAVAESFAYRAHRPGHPAALSGAARPAEQGGGGDRGPGDRLLRGGRGRRREDPRQLPGQRRPRIRPMTSTSSTCRASTAPRRSSTTVRWTGWRRPSRTCTAGSRTTASGAWGFSREVYLEYGMGDPENWVTEIQESLA